MNAALTLEMGCIDCDSDYFGTGGEYHTCRCRSPQWTICSVAYRKMQDAQVEALGNTIPQEDII